MAVCILLMIRYPHAMLNPGELTEGHQQLKSKCFACHKPFWGISNNKCIACHKPGEIGKDTIGINDTTSTIMFHAHLADQKCSSCHTDHKGINPEISLSAFDHEMLPGTMITKCNSCHVKPPDDLHKVLTSSCNNCHTTSGWKSGVTFNHSMIANDDKNNCVSCHQKPGDAFHLQVKDNCDKCHGLTRWKPSTFDHSQYFILDRNHNATCNTCHTTNNFTAYTCYGCHEHSESRIAEKHNEHGIYNFADCASCHRSGDEHDIRMNGNKQVNQEDIKNYIRTEEKNNKKEHDGKKEHDDD